MKHIPNIKEGYYMSKSGREYLVKADRYTDGSWKIVEVEDPMVLGHLIGKKVRRGHGFRLKTRRKPDPVIWDKKGRFIEYGR